MNRLRKCSSETNAVVTTTIPLRLDAIRLQFDGATTTRPPTTTTDVFLSFPVIVAMVN